jgi:hypothetical protein
MLVKGVMTGIYANGKPLAGQDRKAEDGLFRPHERLLLRDPKRQSEPQHCGFPDKAMKISNFVFVDFLSKMPTKLDAVLKLHQANAELGEADIGEGTRAWNASRIPDYPDEERHVLAEISKLSQYSTKKRSTAHAKAMYAIALYYFYVLIIKIYNKLIYRKDSNTKVH